MKTSLKAGLFGALIYILFEIAFYLQGWNYLDFKHLLSFAVSSLILLIFIFDLKNGIQTASIYALLIASFSFAYYKWIDDYAERKKEQLIEMTMDEDAMLELAEKQIESNPDFYYGKSPEDLIDMQQENINANLNPSVVFPFTLFTQLLMGMIFSFVITALNRLVLSKLIN